MIFKVGDRVQWVSGTGDVVLGKVTALPAVRTVRGFEVRVDVEWDHGPYWYKDEQPWTTQELPESITKVDHEQG